ncbi:hypothetical protein ES963_16465 [Bacillus subtilis]|nr:hypothetical protein ES963_16465 [Bacillus subtilis]
MTEEVKRLRCAVADLIGENERLKTKNERLELRNKELRRCVLRLVQSRPYRAFLREISFLGKSIESQRRR